MVATKSEISPRVFFLFSLQVAILSSTDRNSKATHPSYSPLSVTRPEKQALKAAPFSPFLPRYLSLLSLVYLCQLQV